VDLARPAELRCSPAIRALGVDPIGSAVSGTSFLLVDMPLPWPPDVSEDPRFDALHALVADLAAQGRPWRLQATVPGQPDLRRVVAYELPPGLGTGFLRREVTVSAELELAAAVDLLLQPADALGGGVGGAHTDARGDLLICTHGARDVCCGGSGTALWQELSGRIQVLPEYLTLCRTSHAGGHRFAPTALLLPSGTCWAWLDAGIVHAVTHRHGEVADVLHAYRGSCLMGSMAEQCVERAVFAEVGWGWLDHRRAARTTATDDGELVEIAYIAPDGTSGTWTGRTRVVGTSPVPTCGEALDAAPKSAPVVELVGPVEHHPS
jgi:hypothetical protein